MVARKSKFSPEARIGVRPLAVAEGKSDVILQERYSILTLSKINIYIYIYMIAAHLESRRFKCYSSSRMFAAGKSQVTTIVG